MECYQPFVGIGYILEIHQFVSLLFYEGRSRSSHALPCLSTISYSFVCSQLLSVLIPFLWYHKHRLLDYLVQSLVQFLWLQSIVLRSSSRFFAAVTLACSDSTTSSLFVCISEPLLHWVLVKVSKWVFPLKSRKTLPPLFCLHPLRSNKSECFPWYAGPAGMKAGS